MSVEYYLICHKHKEIVHVCSDGLSGPQLQCDKSLAAFSIQHNKCQINIIDENDESCDTYKEWHKNNWKELLTYAIYD